jgi:membrane protein implicated in regulation of membrane protease activity
MMEYLNSLSPLEKFLFGCALFGGAMFLLRTALTLIGINADDDPDASLGDPDAAFKLLSIHGLTAFFMMFGLVGLALSRDNHASNALVIGGGLAAGLFTSWLIGKVFVGMKKLQSDGTLRIENAVGCEGSVYLTIRAGHSGQVRISIQDRLRHVDAISEDGAEIPTGERVAVVSVRNNNTLVVKKI